MFEDDGWADSDITLAAGLTSSSTPGTSLPSIHGLSAFYNPANNSHHVFYIDGNGTLRESVGIPGVGWSATAVTGSVGSANAPSIGFVPANAQGTQLFATYDGSQHVYYFDTNNHVREAQFNGSWTTIDWTAVFQSAPPPAGLRDGIVAATEPNVNHVFYVDTNGHVRELWRVFGNTYGSVDLTTASGTSVLGGSSLTSFVDSSGRLHVAFVGQDSRMHDLVRTSGVVSINPATGAFTYTDKWTGSIASGSTTSVLASRLLSSAYDSVLGTAHVFGLVPNGIGSNALILDLSNPGSGWSQTTSSFSDPPAFP